MKPEARDTRLVVRELPEETLVYDLENDRAHCLSRTAALVWRLCDGKNTVEAMATRLRAEGHVQANEDMVWMALERLGKARLLQDRVMRPATAPNLARRRMMMSSLRAVGMLPFVTSIVAPNAAQAASSCTEDQCEANNSVTCSGCRNAPCSDRRGRTCTRVGGDCDCR